ncbi:MAG: Lrp/AsnC ligand binding domain-containing protein [Nitrososphaerales archaeon]
MKAYIFLQTKPGTSEEVLQHLTRLTKVEGVTQVDSIYGRFDAIVTVEAPNFEQLGSMVYKVVERIPNVIRTETAIVLSQHSK